jgi:hypothetical protein
VDVTTHERRIELRPERDGTTTVVSAQVTRFPIGTRVEIKFDPALPDDPTALAWAKYALRLAGTDRPTRAARGRCAN